jgi:hypothetical protein
MFRFDKTHHVIMEIQGRFVAHLKSFFTFHPSNHQGWSRTSCPTRHETGFLSPISSKKPSYVAVFCLLQFGSRFVDPNIGSSMFVAEKVLVNNLALEWSNRK